MFEENTTTSENNVEVAEPQETVESISENNVEVAEPQQTAEENARFAEMRKRKEYDDLKNKYTDKEKSYNELESNSNAFKDRVKSVLGNYFEADTLEDMLIMAEAQAKGIEASELKSQMEATAKEQEERNGLLEQLAYYQEQERVALEKQGAEMAKADLEALQAIDPSVKNLEQLGEDFVKLRFTVNPLTNEFYSVEEIYNHMKSKIKPLPDNSGKVQSTQKENVDAEFLTSEEVDKITADDYDKNPKLLDIVRKSMSKW